MTQSFKCPSCGGPLEYGGGGEATVRCEFCSNQVVVPEELRAASGFQQHGAIPLSNQLGRLAEVGRLLRSGNKIGAIKLYREIFGVGLAEAREAVENLAAGRGIQVSRHIGTSGMGGWPNQSPPLPVSTLPAAHSPRQSKGCSTFALIALVIGVFITGLAIAFFLFPGTRGGRGASNARPGVSQPVPRTNSRSNGSQSSGFASVALSFGSDGIGAGQFKDARSVAVDGEGHIYAADYTGGRVQVFDDEGKFLTQWMVDAKMPLLRLAADRKGVVYIVQSGDINRYEGLTGKSLGKVPASGRWFNDVAVTADGGLVAVQNGQDIVRFDADGRTVSTIKNAITEQTGDSELDGQVAVDGLGNIYELGTFNNAVFKFSPNGKFINRVGGAGNEAGLFRAPQAVAVDGQGRIYVSDIKGVQVFDANGRYLDVFKIDKSVAFGMVFNDKNELFVAARTELVKYVLNK